MFIFIVSLVTQSECSSWTFLTIYLIQPLIFLLEEFHSVPLSLEKLKLSLNLHTLPIIKLKMKNLTNPT